MTEPYGVGTVSVANGGTVVTGTSTFWVGKVRKNDLFTVPAQGIFARVTADPTENDELAINGWPGTELVDSEYEIISTYIAVDTASRTRELLLGLSLIDPNYDVQVDVLSDRDAYDNKPGPTPTERGFAVLVSDIGDGRSAIYSKVSNASADWSEAAYFSGPTGGKGWSPQLVAEADGERRVLKLAGYVGGEGAEPTDNVGEYLKADGTWTATIGDAVDFRGEGFSFVPGGYDGGTAYAKNDVVRDAGSSWIALQATTGNAPPTLPTTSNAYWELLAQKGADGTGTGDVVGPASSVNNRIAVWDGLTGKLLKDGGKTIAELVPADDSITNAILANMATKTIKGRLTAGTGDPEDLTPAQAREAIAVPIGAYRNILINPLFDHNQRLVSGTVSLSGGAYGHDRMKAGASGCTYTFSTTNGVTTINITAGTLHQVIEAAAFAGRAGEYVASWTGTAQARINAGSYGASGAVKATCDGSANVTVEFNAGTVSLPQFERGYVTDFSARAIPHEDDLCFRYAERLYGAINPGMPTATGGPNKWASWIFKARKRTTPTMSNLGVAYGSTNISIDKCDLGSPAADQPVIADGAFASAEL